jgi:hypothetical protein
MGRNEGELEMDKDYRQVGIESYGDRCEICGYSSIVEVHHVYYQEHQAMEDVMRGLIKAGKEIPDSIKQAALEHGWNTFDKKTLQLDKGNAPHLLSCLCGNCHALIHKMDVGLKLLKAIKPRK